MTQGSSDEIALEGLAKHIQDLQHLVLLLKGLSRAKPWQRQLAGHLADVDQRVQVLRPTRPDVEIVALRKPSPAPTGGPQPRLPAAARAIRRGRL